jgi:hypothetical protein
MTVPALSIRFEVCWFPRISEARPLAPRCGKKGGYDGQLMKCLEDTPDDGTTKVILEGRQTTTICCGSLLGPVHVVGGGSKGADALGGTPPPPPTAFLPYNRRDVSDPVACDKDRVPYRIGGPAGGRLNLRLHVKRGVRASRQYLDEDQVGRILDTVLQARGERLLQRKVMTTTSMTTAKTDAHWTSGINDCAGGMKKPPWATAVGVTAAGPAVPREKRLLFDNDSDDDNNGGGVRGKRTRLAAGGASADAHPPAAQKLGDDGNVKRTQDERKGPPPPPPRAKRGGKRRAGAMGGVHVKETMPGNGVPRVGVGGRMPPAAVLDVPPPALAIDSSSAARCGGQRRRRCHYYASWSCSLDHPLSQLTCKMSKHQPTTIQGHSRCIISQTSSSRT